MFKSDQPQETLGNYAGNSVRYTHGFALARKAGRTLASTRTSVATEIAPQIERQAANHSDVSVHLDVRPPISSGNG